MAKTKKIGAVEKPKKFTLSVEVNGESTKVKTDNIEESLLAYEVPNAIKTEVVISVESGKKTVEHILTLPKARRILNNKTAKILLARDLNLLTNG